MPQTRNKYGKELKRLAIANGGILTARMVVDAARSESSPLHDAFLWDDTVAAEQYRLIQARELIRVQVTVMPQTKTVSRAFVSLMTDRTKQDGGYRLTASVLSDEEMRRQMILDAAEELNVFTLKYARITELAEVFAAGKKFIRKIRKRK